MATTKKKNGDNSWLKIAAFPPVMLLPVSLLALAGTPAPGYGVPLPTPLLTALVFLYLTLSVAYVTLLKKDRAKAAWSASLVANGILFVGAAVEFIKNPIFAWLGVLLLIPGLFMAITQMSPPPKPRFAQTPVGLFPSGVGKTEVKAILATLPFPTAFLEENDAGDGRIVAANQALSAMLGKPVEKLVGTPLEAHLPPDSGGRPIRFADAEWVPHRTTEGKQTLFMLSPAAIVPKPTLSDPSEHHIVDPDTGLYTPLYMQYKAKADVNFCIRYNKRLSVLLLRLRFDTTNLVPPSDEVRQSALSAFGRMISVSIRGCDTAYRLEDDDVAIFLPEASQNAAQTVATRMTDNMKKLAQMECPELGAANLFDASVSLFGEEIASLDQVMKELRLVMKRGSK